MSGFKLLTYLAAGGPRAGVLIGDTIHDAAGLLPTIPDPSTVLGILDAWNDAEPLLRSASVTPPAGGIRLADVTLKAPILYPGAIFCAASNYYAHAKEMNPDRLATRDGKQPYFFLKTGRHTTLGPGDPIRVPRVTAKLDWEVELGAVIGRPCHNVTLGQALDCVAGYTIVNDLSARDLGRREDWPRFGVDWFGQKVFDGAAPIGPWIVPAADIGDPQNLALKLWVNDQIMQDSSTGDMIFNVAEQIEYIARRLTLLPGDVVATGTPGGVGAARGIFLKPGDVIRMEIGGIGSMRNPVVEAPSTAERSAAAAQ
jgi:2-keto-4-pentenoate hydratase/2-oxohepta-3-ene-1,7-dioic acid hydratase in catechol pathway